METNGSSASAARCTALLLGASLSAALACLPPRPEPEATSAHWRAERIAELELRVARDRTTLERYVTSPNADGLPDNETIRAIGWRLPEYQTELEALRREASAAAANARGEDGTAP